MPDGLVVPGVVSPGSITGPNVASPAFCMQISFLKIAVAKAASLLNTRVSSGPPPILRRAMNPCGLLTFAISCLLKPQSVLVAAHVARSLVAAVNGALSGFDGSISNYAAE